MSLFVLSREDNEEEAPTDLDDKWTWLLEEDAAGEGEEVLNPRREDDNEELLLWDVTSEDV